MTPITLASITPPDNIPDLIRFLKSVGYLAADWIWAPAPDAVIPMLVLWLLMLFWMWVRFNSGTAAEQIRRFFGR